MKNSISKTINIVDILGRPVFNKSCWTRIWLPQYGTIENPTPNFAIVPCKGTTCCKVGIKVCRATPNIVSIEVTQPWEENTSCSGEFYRYNYRLGGPSIVYDSTQCNQACEDWINNLDTTGYTSNKFIFSDENKTQIDGFYFEISNNEDLIELSISSDSEYSNSNLKIIDLHGREIHSEILDIIKGFNRKSINTNNLNTGIYLIQLNLGYKHFVSKKIIIVR